MPEKSASGGGAFREYYFANCCGRPYRRDDFWLAEFARIAERIVADIRPRRVLDAGCAFGFLVEALRERGVEAFGCDISEYALREVREDVRPYCWQGSAAGDLRGHYDLIVSIEVLEHMARGESERAVEGFCSAAPDVLFSSSPADYREPTHVNVHPPEHWAELFARHGLLREVDYDATFVTPWAARFRRSNEPLHRVVRSYERRFWELLQQGNQSRQHAAALQDDLEAARRELDERRAAAAEAAHELLMARNWIACMEGSRFWKLRNLYERLRGRNPDRDRRVR